MPSKEFLDTVEEIRSTGKGRKMTKRDFIWLFDEYQKRTSGNVWHINEFLQKERLEVVPDYQVGWIDEEITLKEKDKTKIKKTGDDFNDSFDPINRISVLKAASKLPISVLKEDSLEKAQHILWKHDFSQVPVMNDERNVLGILSWQGIAKGLITKKTGTVKDFMTMDFTVLKHDTPLFEAIKEVMKSGVVFIKDSTEKIKGPVTPSDLNEQFVEQIEPYILLEQIENVIRQILHNKIVHEDLLKLIKTEDKSEVGAISDLNFGQYVTIIGDRKIWPTLGLPFSRSVFTKDLKAINQIRNGVMHFHPDGTSEDDLQLLRKTSKFLMDFLKCRGHS